VDISFRRGFIDEAIAETLLVLIPKENNPTHLKNFRPISLCNVIFKVITKVLVNCIRPFLDELVSPFQSSFIPRRGTTDNAIIAQEVVHYMHTSRSQKGTLALKIDLEKAYDRLDWSFLELTLHDFGFPHHIIGLIMSCVKASDLAILWYGAKTNKFKPTRRTNKGDPLSPYLFVLCIEKLAMHIQGKVEDGSWRPIHISKDGPGLSHLLFADDVLLFCEANTQQVQVVMDTLNEFCSASGLKVNVTKSKSMCSKRVPERTKRDIQGISSIRLVSNLGHYLGFPLVQGRVTNETYKHIIEKMHHRLATWKGKLLNKAGRVCLAKSVTTSMPVYSMQINLLPKELCDGIDKITKSSIWGGNGVTRKWNMVKWTIVTSPRKFGVLAIRDARNTNLALLGKLVWSLLYDKNKLWVRLLSAKYIKNGSLWSSEATRSPSLVWRSILEADKNLIDGFSYRICDENSSFWFSDWTKMGRLCHKVDFVNISDTHLTPRAVGSNGCWNWNALMTNVPSDIVQLVDQHPPPVTYSEEKHDMWIWNDSKTRVYTCKSGYDWLLACNRTWNMTNDWNWVWRIKASAKIQHFVWLCLHEALPVNNVRRRCNLTDNSLCGSCFLTNEDVLHCLRDCHYAREIWKAIPISYTQHFFSTSMTKDWIKEGLQSQPPQVFMSALWWVWRWRNHRILGGNQWKKYDVL